MRIRFPEARRALALARLLLALALFVPLLVGASASYADEDDDKNKSGNEQEHERSQREDHEIAGQVLNIYSTKDPPQIELATTDGKVLVTLVKKDELQKSGVGLGDHISVIGWKVSEKEWMAETLLVDGHLGDEEDDDEDDD